MGQLSVDLSAKIDLLKTRPATRIRTGISFPRYFTSRLEPGKTPYDEVQWETRTADEHLWAEVLNLGGYDVLAEPFERDEMVRVVTSARRHFDYQPERAPAQEADLVSSVA